MLAFGIACRERLLEEHYNDLNIDEILTKGTKMLFLSPEFN
ncbi:hypothetical protein Cylst_2274 [Cylindrospermum stagnale PCC 7417]|uniref:Uncharacterized protein n=1 Tax=Cylindrospermum stagnale PCC 7417 TaxID=56107 RepID=K9WXG4_9NOST|nr:hypothetical protein Cylst_2274 [Cylindrospermum stagnale PCC 7417]